jgi:hypothetical protein
MSRETAPKGCHRGQNADTLVLVRRLLVMVAVALAAAGCDNGGLLKVESTNLDGGTDAGVPVVLGPGSYDFVNSGNVAANGKYKLVFTMGQATPNQAPATGKNGALNGGLVGATETK